MALPRTPTPPGGKEEPTTYVPLGSEKGPRRRILVQHSLSLPDFFPPPVFLPFPEKYVVLLLLLQVVIH